MDKISLALSALLMVTMVILIVPSILALNQGRILRNVALWLAIFLALAIVYQSFDLGKNAPSVVEPSDNAHAPEDDPNIDPPTGENGYTPPKEE